MTAMKTIPSSITHGDATVPSLTCREEATGTTTVVVSMDPLRTVRQALEMESQTGGPAVLPEELPPSPNTNAKVLGSLLPTVQVQPIRKITGRWEAGSSLPKIPGAGILGAGLVAFAENTMLLLMLLLLVLRKRIIGVVRLVHGSPAAVAAVRVCINLS